MRSMLLTSLLLAFILSFTACSKDDRFPIDDEAGNATTDSGTVAASGNKVLMTVGESEALITLSDNDAARDFASRLPLEVTLEDYNNVTEKIFYPDPELHLGDTPRGCSPRPGDIAVYVPWGNIAIFCKELSFSRDLVRIGTIENGGISLLHKDGDVKVRFSLIEHKK